jgi:hypothetical protein
MPTPKSPLDRDPSVKEHPLSSIPTSIGSFFMDSGAHALYNKKILTQPGIRFPGDGDYSYYDLKKGSEFRQYLQAYSDFIKNVGWAIDYYATVDAIFRPDLTWQIQKVLEDEYGLKPVPVIHYGAEMKWIDKYLDAGHDFLGIGGLGQGVNKKDFFAWGDRLFNRLCPTARRIPLVRTHGFAMTSWELIVRYPWWSVDSASWIKAAAFGQVYFPHYREGRGFVFPKMNSAWEFGDAPFALTCSGKSPNSKEDGRHIQTLGGSGARADGSTPLAKRVLMRWLEHINVPLGKVDENGELVEYGILSHHKARAECNLRFFQALADSLPKWPWPFQISKDVVRSREGFGLFG